MDYAFLQGYLDSLCGVYAIVNAEKILNDSSGESSQRLFNRIIHLLERDNKLSAAVIGGIPYTRLLEVILEVLGKQIVVFYGKKKFSGIDDWWEYSLQLMSSNKKGVIILTLGGREDHYTVIKSMTKKSMVLSDSGGIKIIRRSSCELRGYDGDDKYIIYPYQNIYLFKETA